jgi:cytoskeletal protein CcmA (bactofilin family)
VFGSKKNDQFAKGGHTLFAHALEVEGNVRFGGELDIEGTVKGNVIAVESLDARVRVREKGCVNGDIRAPRIIINGQVNGDVYATEHLELAAKALVNGNVHYKVVEMVKGAEVNGSLERVNSSDKVESSSDKKGESSAPATKDASIKVVADA